MLKRKPTYIGILLFRFLRFLLKGTVTPKRGGELGNLKI